MRPAAYLLAIALSGVAFVGLAGNVSAVGYCVAVGGIERNNMADDCDGVTCWGHTNGRWQTCVTAEVHDVCEIVECYCTCPPMSTTATKVTP